MRAVSLKRQRARRSEQAVRDAVFARDGYRCVIWYRSDFGPCGGPLTYHHRRKASAQGAYTEANGSCVCSRHNTAIEDHPDLFRDAAPGGRYLVVRPGDPEWESLGKRASEGRL